MRIIDKELKNGIKLRILNSKEFKSSKITIKFNAGYTNVSNDENQIPHLLEHIIWDYGDDVKLKFAKYGIRQNAWTWDTETVYWMESLPEYFFEMAELILEKIVNPEISQEKFNREIGNVETELATERTEPQQLLFDETADLIFENRISEKRKKSSLKNINLDKLRNFYDEFYSTDNSRIVIWGNFFDEEISKIVKMLENWQLKRSEEKSTVFIRSSKKGASKSKIDGENKYFQHISHLGELNYRERAAANICYRFLTHGDSGRAYRELRDRGLLYDIYCGVWKMSDNSHVLEVNFSALEKNYDVAYDIFEKWVLKLVGGDFSEEDLDFLKLVAKNDWRMENKDFSDRVEMEESVFIAKSEFSEEKYLAAVEVISREDVVEFAKFAFENFIKEGKN